MQGAFHGRTMGAMALTSSKTFYKTGFAPLMPQTFTAPYPYCLHCKTRQAAPDGRDWYKASSRLPEVIPVLLCEMFHILGEVKLGLPKDYTKCTGPTCLEPHEVADLLSKCK